MTIRFELTQTQASNPNYECVQNCKTAPFKSLTLVAHENSYQVFPNKASYYEPKHLRCSMGRFLLDHYVFTIQKEGPATSYEKSVSQNTGVKDFHNTFTTIPQEIQVPEFIDLRIEGANVFALDAQGTRQIIDYVEKEELVHDCNDQVETMTSQTPVYLGAFISTEALNRCEMTLTASLAPIEDFKK